MLSRVYLVYGDISPFAICNCQGRRTPMLRSALVGLAAAVLVGTAFVPDDALAFRGGGRGGGFHGARASSFGGGTARAVGYRGMAGRGYGYRGGAYRAAAYRGAAWRGAAIGAAAIGAAAVGAAAYGAYGGYDNGYYGGYDNSYYGGYDNGYYGGTYAAGGYPGGYYGGVYANRSYVTGRPTLFPRYYGGWGW